MRLKSQLTQGLVGVFTFGINPENPEHAQRLEMTSQYLAEEDHIRVLKKDSGKGGEEVKIFDMKTIDLVEDAEKTDDGLTHEKNQDLLESGVDAGPFSTDLTPKQAQEDVAHEPREDDLGSSEESPLIKKLRRITEMNQENE